MEPCQIGFKKSARTSDHMFVLRTIIEKLRSSKTDTLYACFIDFKKAFDTVWQNGLLLKLQSLQISGQFYKMIKSIYSNVSSCVKIGQNRTTFFKCKLGVKQGETLSPALFNIFINDLPKSLSTENAPKLNNIPIGCLMFADDVILLTKSKQELQENIDSVAKYCKTWNLEVNIKKTKIMKFSRNGHVCKDKFTYNDETLECVQNYKYLGIIFTQTGNYKLAQDSLMSKASKAMFKIRSLTYNLNLKTTIKLKLFEQLVVPILLYGCEIWGPNKIKKDQHGNLPLYEYCDKLIAEKLHLKFCRYLLGCHKSSPKAAIRGELGRYPLLLQIWHHSIKYWYHIHSLDTNSIAHHAHMEQSILKNESTWLNSIKQIIHLCSLNHIVNPKNKLTNKAKRITKSAIRTRYNQSWLNHLQTNKKLKDSYAKFKYQIVLESYLDNPLDFHTRKSMAMIRTSSHNLRVETGRHKKIEKEMRTCQICIHKNDVEDEQHFLIKCDAFSVIRNNLFISISKLCKNFMNLSDSNKFIYLMSVEKDEQSEIASFCHEALQIRTNLLNCQVPIQLANPT